MRAALLPTPGEPFMLAYWLRNFETWRDEVDELLVYVNGTHDSGGMVESAGGRVIVDDKPIGHGPAIKGLLEGTEAEYIVLCEDDAYVRTPGAVQRAFKRLEAGKTDIIGSPRYEDRVSDTIEKKWPAPTGQPIDLNRALWPAFLFAKRADLMATDQRFGDVWMYRGENIPGLDMKVTRELCDHVGASPLFIHVDTFYATTYQLRDKRIELVHRVRLLDPLAVETWLRYNPPWFHITGLSAIETVLEGQTTALPDYWDGGGLWPRRVAWWERTYRSAPELHGSDYGRRYRGSLDSFRSKVNLDADDIEAWDARLAPWVTW